SRYAGANESVAMLTRVAERSDDPEVQAALAVSLKRVGRIEESRELLRKAAARYDELTARHPAAFADHAARFWLDPGDDPDQAHALALANLEPRETPVALDLALTTALAAGRQADACALARRGLAVPHAHASLRDVATAVAANCAPDAR